MIAFGAFEKSLPYNKIVKDAVNALNKDGVCKVHLSDIVDNYDQVMTFVDQKLSYFHDHKEQFTTNKSRMYDLTKRFYFGNDPRSELMVNQTVISIVARYMKMVPKFIGTKIVYHVPDTATELSNHQNRHRDYHEKHGIKTFILLKDIDEGCGPTQFIKGSHSSGPSGKIGTKVGEKKYYSDEELKNIIDDAYYKDNLILCTGKKGDVYFVDTYGFHRGGKCKSNDRLLAITGYASHLSLSSDVYEVDESLLYIQTSPLNQMVVLT